MAERYLRYEHDQRQAVITTIVLKILLIIIAVIVILLHFSVTVYVKGGTDTDLVIRAKYLGFTLYPRPEKKKKKKRKKKDKDDEEDILDEALEETQSGESDEDEDISVSEEKDEVTDIEEEHEDHSEDTAEEKTEEEISEDKPADKNEEKRKKKEKKEKNKKEKKEKGEGKLDELKRKWEFIKPYIPPAWKYSKKLLKAIRLDDIKINIVTGKEDAAESATFYGKLQAALFNTLNFLAMIFTLNVKEANVRCVFNEKRLDAEGETTVRVRPSTVIAIAFCLLWCAGKIFIPYKLKQYFAKRKAKKEAKKKTAITTEETA